MTNTTFSSISSDNNLFDFEMMIRRIRKDMKISDYMYTTKVREYLLRKHPELNNAGEPIQAAVVAMFIMAKMSFSIFIETLDALGVKLEMSLTANSSNTELPKVEEPASPIKLRRQEFFDKPIEELGLSTTFTAILRSIGGIETFGQLVDKKLDDIEKISGVTWGQPWGPRIQALTDEMKKHGLVFGMLADETEMALSQDIVKQNAVLCNKPIDTLNLPIRVINVLRFVGDIETFADLVAKDKSKIMRLHNFGENSWRLLEESMKKNDLIFGMYTSVDELGKLPLSVRVNTLLKAKGFTHISQLCRTSVQELLKVPNITQPDIHHIEDVLKAHGQCLKDSVPVVDSDKGVA